MEGETTYTPTNELCLRSMPENVKSIMVDCVDYIEDKLIINPPVKIYGKIGYQHRSIGFFSNESIGYKYSGQIIKSQKLDGILLVLINYVNEIFGATFNAILVNKYNDGLDYIGKHSDDEKSLDPNVGVVCISHGVSRIFRIRDKFSGKIILDLNTNSDSILHMRGKFQERYTHEIPVQKKIKEPRYSFTFRKHTE